MGVFLITGNSGCLLWSKILWKSSLPLRSNLIFVFHLYILKSCSFQEMIRTWTTCLPRVDRSIVNPHLILLMVLTPYREQTLLTPAYEGCSRLTPSLWLKLTMEIQLRMIGLWWMVCAGWDRTHSSNNREDRQEVWDRPQCLQASHHQVHVNLLH